MRQVERGRCASYHVNPWVYRTVAGASDPNCGAAYEAAEDDTVFGLFDGCGQPNPSIAPMAPTVLPVCSA